MKKICAIILIFAMTLSACSIQARSPKGGEWYCEELNLLLDFSDPYGVEPAKCYHEDGTYEVGIYLLDYGNGIHISSKEQSEECLIGKFKYKNDIFTITENSTGKEYIFKKTDADVIVLKEESYFDDFSVQGSRVYIKCQVTLENSYTSDKKVVLKGDFSEDKGVLLKEAEIQAIQADDVMESIVIPAGEKKTVDVIFIGEFARVKQKANRLLPEIDVEILDSYEES